MSLRNVEIKARVQNVEVFVERIRAMVAVQPERVIEQDDTFFSGTQEGTRLKLRTLSPMHGELIAYKRPDNAEATTSAYSVYVTNTPEKLHAALTAAYGVRGRVVKRRRLWIVGRTRVHLDEVQGLPGTYMELECVLRDGEPEKAGRAEVHILQSVLGVKDEDLLTFAYVDMLAELSPQISYKIR